MGRKPKYGKAMSATERSRLYRERKAAEGAKEFHFTMNAEFTKTVDELVEFYELSGRAQLVSDLLASQLVHAVKTMRDWQNNQDLPDSDEEMSPEDKQVVSKSKSILWTTICSM